MTFEDYQQGYQQLYYREPPAAPPRRRRAPLVITLAAMGLVALLAVLAITHRQQLVDQWTVWNFEPSSVIQGYVDRSTMTDHGEFLFYASQPVVTDGERFNTVCENNEEGSGVLGCYTSTDKVITLFDITDPQLDGMEEVVAAHEMLHAAWDRMGADERARLTVLLEAEATALSGDADFTARMDIYARTEPRQRVNELHSIVGTEIADLSPELEQYYSQYFDGRASVVALNTSSSAVFKKIEEQTAALVAEIDQLKLDIEADLDDYNSGYDQLNLDIEDFNRRADAGDFETQQQFDSERAALLSRQATLDALFGTIETREATYNAKVAQLTQLNAAAAALNTAINVVPRTVDE
jgi:hypothetical protein